MKFKFGTGLGVIELEFCIVKHLIISLARNTFINLGIWEKYYLLSCWLSYWSDLMFHQIQIPSFVEWVKVHFSCIYYIQYFMFEL